MSARDPLQRFAHLLEREYRLDLGAQPARLDQPAIASSTRGVTSASSDSPTTPWPSWAGAPTRNIARPPSRTVPTAWSWVWPPAASKRTSTPPGTTASTCCPVGGVVIEHLARAQAPQVIAVTRAGHAQRAVPHGRGELHGGVADAPRRGDDKHGLIGLQPPPVDQSVPGRAPADHQGGRLLEAQPLGHARQTIRICHRILGKNPPPAIPRFAHTRSPGLTSTPSPTASTTPATSNPGM